MKRSGAAKLAFLVLIFLVFTASVARPEFLVLDLFDNLPTGQIPEGWSVVGEDKGVYVVENPDANNKSLQIEGVNGGIHVRRAFEPTADTITVETRFMPVTMTGGNYGIPYVQEQGVNLGGPVGAVCILLRDGKLDYYNGAWENFATIVEGKWYEVKIVTSAKNKEFDLYFDGEEIVKGALHRFEYPALGELLFGPGVAHTGGNVFLYDYVVVYEGTEIPFDPFSVSASGKLAAMWGEVKLDN